MEVLHPRCAGLDVHSELVVACARIAEGQQVRHDLAEFGTSTRELLRLQEWLLSHGVTHVAMEATGVYWKPVWHILEGSFEMVLGNAKQMKTVPGRKSDQKDAAWIADLLAHGLIRASFVPPTPIQELRDLTRTRKQMMGEHARHVQRIQKVLEDANIKLTSVLTDIMGVSGRKILNALAEGERNPEKLARLADPRVKAPRAKIVEALQGNVTEHHRFMFSLHLMHIESVEAAVAALEARIEEALEPFRHEVELLCTMPGIKRNAAASIIAEIGVDMSVFPSADHLVGWGSISPGLNKTGGKTRSSRTKPGRWLKATMTQCAWAASHQRNCYLNARFHRIKSRRGSKKAVIAVANTMLRAIYHMLKNDAPYQDLGPDFFERENRDKTVRRLTTRLKNLGYEVEIRKAA
ncbi:MAG TPA: IS110 family transposase [Longimicrobium sp.]|jgi:transposase